MWPFKRKSGAKAQPSPAPMISFSQVDTTERFGDNLTLKPEDWIKTTPLNSIIPSPQSAGLPPIGASDDDVFTVASRLSSLRERMGIPTDGVYCPVCHIANVDLNKLRTPCPKCHRELLTFGWD